MDSNEQHLDRIRHIIATTQRHGITITDAERAAAVSLCNDMLHPASRHGIAYEDFRWVGSLPTECLDVILARRGRVERETRDGEATRCGNNLHTRLAPGDRQAVQEFRAYLADCRRSAPPAA